ncbi:MAG TPA: hypothetical protein VET26_02060 [Candidatus Sulfotelmatobacter sp.]|nr:hypothetical protein [Candidatus Sulfotelmatobacter sp.]
MQLKPLYTVRFLYPDGWDAAISGPFGTEEEDFFFAEGRCEGEISGRFFGANHPRRRTDATDLMDFQGVIETDGGARLLFDYQGYGRGYGRPGRRQVVGTARHFSEHEAHKRLNDAICVIVGEVRRPDPPPARLEQKDIRLVFDVAELIWEPPTE